MRGLFGEACEHPDHPVNHRMEHHRLGTEPSATDPAGHPYTGAAAPGRIGPLGAAIIDNPHSGRNRRHNPVAGQAARHQNLRIREAVTPHDVKGALLDLADSPPDLVIVNGGDGTAQSVMRMLLEHRPFPHQPLVAILPAGTTNMTAGDIGMRGNRLRALNRLLDWAERPGPEMSVMTRPVLRVRSPLETRPLYGMFFGASAVLQGIRFCRAEIHSRGIKGELGPALATARLVLDQIFERSKHLRSEPITLQADEGPAQDIDSLVLVVSALDRLFLGLRPFWNSRHGALHLTLIRDRPEHLLRVLPALLRGRHHPMLTPEHGYLNQGIRELRLSLDGGFTLDGELHESDSARGPLLIDSGGELNFVRP